jgi:ATP synthase protein I
MNDDPEFADQIAAKAARKLKARRDGTQSAWLGLGMMGLVGWSVAVPTLGGALLGMWLDEHYKASHSWTLALLVAGLCIGCANAWHWVIKEDKAIANEEKD